MSLASALLARLRRDQSGFTLIETLVSAAMVVLVSVGVLKTLDAASNRSSDQKFRSVAANLAQQDQERLRAFRAQELSNYTETRCVLKPDTGGFIDDPQCDDNPTVGPKYKIVSRTDWVSDQSGTRACGSGSRADYLRINSTVIWIDPDTAETGSRRVSLTSVVAPRVGSFGEQGSLSIEILDRNGNGRPSVPVSLTGPKALSGTTDQNGCLFFGYLPQGNYTVNVSQAGLIDADGNTNVAKQFGVVEGSVTSAVVELDQAATLNVNFQSKKVNTVVSNQKADAVSISHSGLAAPGWRAIPWSQVNTPQATYTISNLFPFTSGYAVYSGGCPGNSPDFSGYTTFNWDPAFATLTPGGTTTVTVHEPAVLVTHGGNWPGNIIPTTTAAGPYVVLKPEATFGGSPTYCSDSIWFQTLRDASSGSGAWLVNLWDTADFGVPAGAYDMCVVWHDGAGWKYRLLSNPASLQPLDDGPSGTNASVSVAKPTSTTSCV